MAPRPQIIGQSAQLPDGTGIANGDASIADVQSGAPAAVQPDVPAPRLDPTRYGDWERNGRCIDF